MAEIKNIPQPSLYEAYIRERFKVGMSRESLERTIMFTARYRNREEQHYHQI